VGDRPPIGRGGRRLERAAQHQSGALAGPYDGPSFWEPPPLPPIIIHTIAPIISMHGITQQQNTATYTRRDEHDRQRDQGSAAPHHLRRMALHRSLLG